MKKNINKISMLVLAMFLVVVGCNSNNDGTAETNSAQQEETKTETEVEASEAASEKTSTEADTGELTQIDIGYGNHLGCALYFIAQEEGYFEDYGLNVNLEVLPDANAAAAALQSGKLDAASFGSTQTYSLIEQGQDVVIYGGQMHEGSALVTLPENSEELKDLSNYQGKTVGFVRMTTGDVIFRSGLQDAGLTIGEDVEVVELNDQGAIVEAVKKGEIDAGGVWMPQIENSIQQGLSLAMLSGEIQPNHPCAVMVSTRETLDKSPETFVKIHKALLKAFYLFETDQDQSIEDIQKYLDLDKEVLIADAYGRYTPNPEINVEANLAFWEMMKDVGYAESDKNVLENIDETYFNQAIEEMIEENPDNDFYKEVQKGGYGSKAI